MIWDMNNKYQISYYKITYIKNILFCFFMFVTLNLDIIYKLVFIVINESEST